MTITSSAFVNNGFIPTIHADTFCGGTNLSPPLEFSGVPANAQSLALIMEDASFGSLTHWIFWNLPATTTSISAGADDTLSAISGNNAADFAGYLGPCPPPSETHDYHFTLYALDTNVNLVNGSTKAQLTSAIQNNIIEQVSIIGQFTG